MQARRQRINRVCIGRVILRLACGVKQRKHVKVCLQYPFVPYRKSGEKKILSSYWRLDLSLGGFTMFALANALLLCKVPDSGK